MSTVIKEDNTKTILDVFTYDLSTFFLEEDYDEISCIEEAGIFMIEYEKNLPWLECDLFSKLVFRVFNDKKNIIGSSHINVSFLADVDKINKYTLTNLINSLTQIYGRDDENLGEWNFKDEGKFSKHLIERFWTRGEGKNVYTIKLTHSDSEGLIFKILFFNHLLNLTQSN